MNYYNKNISKNKIIIIGSIILVLILCIIIYLLCTRKHKLRPQPPQPQPVPPHDINEDFENECLTSSTGTMRNEDFPYITDKYDLENKKWPSNMFKNSNFKSDIYKNLILSDFSKQNKTKCSGNDERSKLLSYINAVYYMIDLDNLQKLTDDQLTSFYRCLTFYFITTPETQPDGGWYGKYWKNHIQDYGPKHNKITGSTNMTSQRNEIFPFDEVMTRKIPKDCPGYEKIRGKCPPHSKFFGNRIFSDCIQSTMRRGMRNSPQVLSENPPWSVNGIANERYGLGGFPKNSYVEMLQFPQEHGISGWPTGCDAVNVKCTLENFELPKFQPNNKNRKQGGDPFCGQKPQWFYFSQGLGQFWNMGETSYCYNYVDLFLNAPKGIGKNSSKGKLYPIGWSNGFSPCTDKIGFPPGAGGLGYDLDNTSEPTQNDYENPAWSVKLLLEYESRTDIPGSCGTGKNCQPGLRDPRTGMMGVGFCGKVNKECPCSDKYDSKSDMSNDFAKCLNQRGPGMGQKVKDIDSVGCGANQPVNSRQDALNEQIASLMGLKRGTYWNPYKVPDVKTYNLNKAKGIVGELNKFGGYDPTDAWKKARTKTNPEYPKRSKKDKTTIRDNRRLVCGWVNGKFYGYPKGRYLYDKVPNPFVDGIAGVHPQTGKIIYGKYNSEEDPTIYYDMYGKELYRTWYGKKLELDEDTALRLFAEFYSCGDTGFENFKTNWPFGCYFGYGQSLGGPGKAATNALSCYPYNCTTVQFTCTPTAYGSVVQPAYDFEVLYMPPVKSNSRPTNCTCATSVTLDLTADFKSDNPGKDLKRYLSLNKGSIGGYVPVDSEAGKTAKAFQGKNQRVTNFTYVSTKDGSFDPYKKNKFGVDSNPKKLDICK